MSLRHIIIMPLCKDLARHSIVDTKNENCDILIAITIKLVSVLDLILARIQNFNGMWMFFFVTENANSKDLELTMVTRELFK